MFYIIQNDIGKEWEQSLWPSIEGADVKERQNAILNKQFSSDGTPMISVYVDGSWNKRPYGNYNYNSLTGLVTIVGKHE
ncbi:hypothetical protein ILUMI_08897 [Ignelater luminosus]|uniref:Mutator-like transposase domain-containing protein n=1 Tax=Ignelater luminosus TaxID=2038154 RepID=A0A8K0D0U0_IGNLU|nr:hypothetical protein ILUMI_08897 [Ignelater luminosus]